MPRIIYVDMDGVLCDFRGAYSRDKKRFPNAEFPQSRKGFYEDLAPLPGAIDAMDTLMGALNISPFILTAPSVYNPLSYTEKRIWTENHLGFKWVEKLIISPNKSLLRGDILIDDHIAGRGQENFQGRLIHFGSPKTPDWASVLADLQTLF